MFRFFSSFFPLALANEFCTRITSSWIWCRTKKYIAPAYPAHIRKVLKSSLLINFTCKWYDKYLFYEGAPNNSLPECLFPNIHFSKGVFSICFLRMSYYHKSLRSPKSYTSVLGRKKRCSKFQNKFPSLKFHPSLNFSRGTLSVILSTRSWSEANKALE